MALSPDTLSPIESKQQAMRKSRRRTIAKKGKRKYFKYFNSNIVSQYIINKTFEFKTKKTLWEK